MRMAAAGGAPAQESNEKSSDDSNEDTVSKTIRTYFPETWLWDLVTIEYV